MAGGTATLTRSGNELFEFLPVGEMFNVAEAIIRVFRRLGDYKHKQRNRLKFLVRSLGWDAFKAEFDKELEAFRLEGGARLPFDPERPPVEEAPDGRADAPAAEDIALSVTLTARSAAPGSFPASSPSYLVRKSSTGCGPTSGRRSRQATRWSRSPPCSAT